MRRKHCVMLRLSDAELDSVARAKPDGEELASFARRVLVTAASDPPQPDGLKRAAAFIVASLSPDIAFEEALGLFDDYASSPGEEALDGVRH